MIIHWWEAAYQSKVSFRGYVVTVQIGDKNCNLSSRERFWFDGILINFLWETWKVVVFFQDISWIIKLRFLTWVTFSVSVWEDPDTWFQVPEMGRKKWEAVTGCQVQQERSGYENRWFAPARFKSLIYWFNFLGLAEAIVIIIAPR